MLFDSHIHFFPDKLAPRAMSSLTSVAHYDVHSDGTRANTEENFRLWGCDGGLALHIATNPHQQTNVNDFAKLSQHGNILSFGSVHPDAKDAIAELERIAEMGLKGIKLHPDYQSFYVEEPRLYPIYQKCVELSLPVVFHAGWDPVSPDDVHCRPEKLLKVANKFPDLKIIAAHMGASFMPQEAEQYLSGTANIWFDTAFMDRFLDAEKFERLVHAFGANKILYATDCPWSQSSDIVNIIEGTSLSDDDKERIYWKNAFELLGISDIKDGEIIMN